VSTLALELDGVDKVFQSGDGEVVALKAAVLKLARGEMCALMGPSGSGKSTLLLIAGLLEPPTRGTVAVGGKLIDIAAAAPATLRDFRRRQIGFVFQKANLIPFLTARENVQIALEIDDVDASQARAQALELLGYLDVGHRADNPPQRLSGGEQQRVAVARAIANRPSLILADEPTAALDGRRGRAVIELFRRISREQDAGVLVVTHDSRALDLFDRVVEIEDGRLQV
jgi:putative ABC transport system ATP-binding protein